MRVLNSRRAYWPFEGCACEECEYKRELGVKMVSGKTRKPRKIAITLEVSTDVALHLLKHAKNYKLTVGFELIKVLQAVPIVIQEEKEGK